MHNLLLLTSVRQQSYRELVCDTLGRCDSRYRSPRSSRSAVCTHTTTPRRRRSPLNHRKQRSDTCTKLEAIAHALVLLLIKQHTKFEVHNHCYVTHFYPRVSERICFHRRWFVCVCVCVSVTTITKKIVDGFAPNFMRSFLGEREDHVRVSLQSVEGCGSNGQKTP